jgi:hypothetical protein
LLWARTMPRARHNARWRSTEGLEQELMYKGHVNSLKQMLPCVPLMQHKSQYSCDTLSEQLNKKDIVFQQVCTSVRTFRGYIRR